MRHTRRREYRLSAQAAGATCAGGEATRLTTGVMMKHAPLAMLLWHDDVQSVGAKIKRANEMRPSSLFSSREAKRKTAEKKKKKKKTSRGQKKGGWFPLHCLYPGTFLHIANTLKSENDRKREKSHSFVPLPVEANLARARDTAVRAKKNEAGMVTTELLCACRRLGWNHTIIKHVSVLRESECTRRRVHARRVNSRWRE